MSRNLRGHLLILVLGRFRLPAAARLIWQPFNNIILGLAVQVGRYPGILLVWWQLVIAYSILPMFGAQYSRLKDVSERVSFMLIQSREPHLLCDLLRILIPCRVQTPGGSVHQEMDAHMQSASVVVIGRHSLKHMQSSVDFFSLFSEQILVKIHTTLNFKCLFSGSFVYMISNIFLTGSPSHRPASLFFDVLA